MKTRDAPLKEKRIPFMVDEDQLACIDAWWHDARYPSRAEAMRRLIDIGLKSDPLKENRP
jgi:hypothetical protein